MASSSGPIAIPPASCTVPIRPQPYSSTSTEYAKLQEVLSFFADPGLEIYANEAEEKKQGKLEPLTDWEKMFLSEEMLLRYLKATKWNTANAITRLNATLIWRRTLGMYDVRKLGESIAPEMHTGKAGLYGYTRLGQPVLYNWPSKATLPSTDMSVNHMMFVLDRMIDLIPAGVPGVMWCADVSGKQTGASGAGFRVSRTILSNLQAHYPERLGAAALVKVPWMGALFVTVIWPFVDPDTRKKIFINPDLHAELIRKEDGLKMYGGDHEYEYRPEHLDELIDICIKRRDENMQRWKAAGGKVGISEWDFLPHLGDGNVAGGIRDIEKGVAIGQTELTGQTTAVA